MLIAAPFDSMVPTRTDSIMRANIRTACCCLGFVFAFVAVGTTIAKLTTSICPSDYDGHFRIDIPVSCIRRMLL